jgi:hypothetical protein
MRWQWLLSASSRRMFVSAQQLRWVVVILGRVAFKNGSERENISPRVSDGILSVGFRKIKSDIS